MDRGASEGESMEFRRIKDLIECAQKECEALSLEKKQRDAASEALAEEQRQEYERGQLTADYFAAEFHGIDDELNKVIMVSTTIQSAWNDYLQGQNVDFESLSDKCIQCCHQSSACIAKCNEVRGGMVNFIEDCKFHEWDDLLEEGHQMVSSVDMHIDMLHDTVEIIENLQSQMSAALAQAVAGKSFQCPICITEVSTEDLFVFESCGHELCRGCAQETVTADLNCGQIPLVCPMCKAAPCKNCPINKFPNSDNNPQFCELAHNELELICSPDDINRYYRVQLNIAVNKSGGTMVRCPKDDCTNVIGRDPEENHCICYACNHAWCESCHVDWHENQTCAQYQEWKEQNEKGDENMEEMKQQGLVRECPNCHSWGMRGKGECNATWCLHCGGTFCWLCGISLSHTSNPHTHFSERGPCYEKLFEGVY